MSEILNILIGFFILILGIPIGNFLAKYTKEELKDGKLWFNLIILIALISSVAALIIGNDALMFSFLFIAIVSSRSLKKINYKKGL